MSARWDLPPASNGGQKNRGWGFSLLLNGASPLHTLPQPHLPVTRQRKTPCAGREPPVSLTLVSIDRVPRPQAKGSSLSPGVPSPEHHWRTPQFLSSQVGSWRPESMSPQPLQVTYVTFPWCELLHRGALSQVACGHLTARLYPRSAVLIAPLKHTINVFSDRAF